MHCPLKTDEGAEILMDYFAGKGAGQNQELQEHVESCADCGAFVTGQAATWSLLDEFEAKPVSEDFDRKLFARIDQETRPAWRQWLLWPVAHWKPAVSLAAVTAALTAAFLLNTPVNDHSAQDPVGVEATLEVEQVERALEDLEMLKQLSPDATTQEL